MANPIFRQKIWSSAFRSGVLEKEFFAYPLLAIGYQKSRGISVWPALMEDLFNEAEVDKLKKALRENGIRAELELECLEAYPFVLENMRKRGVLRREK